MLETKNKLRLSALLIAVGIITISLCYGIISDRILTSNFIVIPILIAIFVAVVITRLKNPNLVSIFLRILDFSMFSYLGRDTNVLEKQINIQQIKNKEQDKYIRSKPVLYFIVVVLIIILLATFITALFYQLSNLMK